MKPTVKRILSLLLVLLIAGSGLGALSANAITAYEVLDKLNALDTNGYYVSGYGNLKPGTKDLPVNCWRYILNLSKYCFGSDISIPSSGGGNYNYIKGSALGSFYRVEAALTNCSYDQIVALLKKSQPGDLIGYYNSHHIENDNYDGHIMMIGNNTGSKLTVYQSYHGEAFKHTVDLTVNGLKNLPSFGYNGSANFNSSGYGISLFRCSKRTGQSDWVYTDEPTTPPTNCSISANVTSIGIGDTVTFDYSILGATAKGIGIDRGGIRYASFGVSSDSGQAVYTFNEAGTYCCIIEGYNNAGYNCSHGVYVTVIDTIPTNCSISANVTSIGIGDTVTFDYYILGATAKGIGIDRDGIRYASFGVSSDSGQAVYTFNEAGTYCCIIEGYNNAGYNCSHGVYVTVIDTIPTNCSISANVTSIGIGDTVTFDYYILGATAKGIGIDRDGIRYASFGVSSDSGQAVYTFNEAGTYCCIVEGYNNVGYNCSHGVYITVVDYNTPGKPSFSNIEVCNSNRTVTFEWEAVSNATCYNLFIYSAADTNTAVQSHWAIRKTSFTTELPDGTYVARICSENETNTQNYYTNGDLSASFVVDNNIPDKPVLTNIEINNYNGRVTFTWGAVPNATCYNLFIYSTADIHTAVQSHWVIRKTSFTTELPDGAYVACIGSENETNTQNYYTNGDLSESFVVQRIMQYTVAFDSNGGTGAPASQTKTYGQALTLTIEAPTREGYTFMSWNTQADGMGTSYAPGASYTTEADVTLYAQWIANPPVVNPAIGSGTVVDKDAHFIYGLSAGAAQGCVAVTDGTAAYEYSNAKQALGTGTVVNIYNNDNDLVNSYTVLVFGDIDGDGWYDGTDAYFVSLVANGLVSANTLTDAQLAACDANHDGVIDEDDVALLEQAGLLLKAIDQNAAPEELETDSVYLEYCGLIDQLAEIAEPEQPTQAEETPQPAAQTVPGWIKALFAIMLNWLLNIF